MKKIALSLFLAILLFALPQTVSTSPGSESAYVFLGWWGLDDLGDTGWHDLGTGRVGDYDGLGDGQFFAPRGVAVDSAGYVYVADSYNNRIQKFDSFGGFLGWWGLDDEDNTGWHPPDSGRIPNENAGEGDGQFDEPWDVAVDSAGYVYVADTYNHRIQKFDSEGDFKLKWGSNGTEDGQFKWPRGLAVDSAGNVYVADTSNNRIQKFDSAGNFITKWGSSGTGEGQFYLPGDVAVDSKGDVYVIENFIFYSQIHKFTYSESEEKYVFDLKWGGYGSGDGQLSAPWGIAVDSDDNIYVADTSNHRIQKFTYSESEEKYVFDLKWGSYGSGDGQFYFPYGVAVDSEGNIYVADTLNDRIHKIGIIPPLGVTSPNGGEIWIANTTHEITWDPGVDNDSVKIEFSVNNGTDWEEIIDYTDNNGSYDWTVPCNLSVDCLVRITGLDDLLSDVSDDVFTIESSTPPAITLIGLPEIVLECGTGTYTDDGATAEDGCGYDVPVVVKGDNEVDTMSCGTYEITYDAIDASGQAATQVIRTVIVRDTTPPVPVEDPLLVVEGECSVVIETAPTATDNCTELPITGTTNDPLSYTEVGTYTVTWTYDDGNGNITKQTQAVNVIDVTPPVPVEDPLPAVEGECSVVIETAPTAKDNCAGIITGETTDPREYTKSGTYTVTWVYDDGNGNTTTQTQTVKVEDVTPPTIDLSDSTCVDVHRWKNANLLTVSATDNCSSDVEVKIDKVEIFNKGGRRVWGRGIYRVDGNDIYVFPNGRDWSIRVTATAADSNGNTATESITKPLQQCNRWSAQMARLLRLIHIFLWRMHRCW